MDNAIGDSHNIALSNSTIFRSLLTDQGFSPAGRNCKKSDSLVPASAGIVTVPNSGNVRNNAELIDGKPRLATMFGRTLWLDSRHWVFRGSIHEQGSDLIIVRYTARIRKSGLCGERWEV